MQLAIQGQPGLTYQIEATDDVGAGDWQPWSMPKLAGTNGVATWTDAVQSSRAQRFFRVVRLDPAAADQQPKLQN